MIFCEDKLSNGKLHLNQDNLKRRDFLQIQAINTVGYLIFLIHPFILSQEKTVSNVTNIYSGIGIKICSVFFYTRYF